MRKAAHTVNRNARAGERHKWKDRERRRKEERQRMAAEALILEDAYQRGYTDAVEDMRKKRDSGSSGNRKRKPAAGISLNRKPAGL